MIPKNQFIIITIGLSWWALFYLVLANKEKEILRRCPLHGPNFFNKAFVKEVETLGICRGYEKASCCDSEIVDIKSYLENEVKSRYLMSQQCFEFHRAVLCASQCHPDQAQYVEFAFNATHPEESMTYFAVCSNVCSLMFESCKDAEIFQEVPSSLSAPLTVGEHYGNDSVSFCLEALGGPKTTLLFPKEGEGRCLAYESIVMEVKEFGIAGSTNPNSVKEATPIFAIVVGIVAVLLAVIAFITITIISFFIMKKTNIIEL